MLIVSKYHDYYDTASAYGIDKTVVYKRSQDFIKLENKGWNSDYSIRLPDGSSFPVSRDDLPRGNSVSDNLRRGYTIEGRIVAFCGEFYPVVTVTKDNTQDFVFYSAQDYLDFMVENKISYKSYYSPRWDRFNLNHPDGVKNFFDTSYMAKYKELFHAFKAPSFLFGDNRGITFNPNLKEYKFMKIKDPQTAFQDLYMFISGVIGVPAKETVEISDKDKAAAKGHDGKYSFKKPPGGGRWR